MRLRSMDVPMRAENGNAVAEFTLRGEQKAAFVLEEVRDHEPSASEAEHFVAQSFKETMNFWRDWMARSTYKGRWREMVNRSALVLKLLTSQRYGSIVAAPTFRVAGIHRRGPQLGLPLHPGSATRRLPSTASTGWAITTRAPLSCAGSRRAAANSNPTAACS